MSLSTRADGGDKLTGMVVVDKSVMEERENGRREDGGDGEDGDGKRVGG
ncbi:hypothetical protein SOVF_145840 [Spinacia oleracea]|nr:hypothetical protein SOVF_145840 [Spinacia oleracea]